ncbi:LpxI family protein [Maridesulfovibrio ferrireducens]|uniref:LpxI family protein n=1 Tax=Maridesulfovibrio ferrireducens TaxID=246191 RepID=UPI001A2019B8|nr:UDP-2,3-diacylglucosamine diphosphatase LpxI [Maridesulfovibrio ferrireducens]MBI9110552.1 UDP-2,3-diacylglucosamine diphosphatase LpxI [Maridesulfovibrio ferrireducens]
MNNASETIGLIAGGGQFPLLVAKGAAAQGNRVVAVSFKGHSNDEVHRIVDVWKELKLGQFSKLINFFLENGVTKVVMAGTINKPKAFDIRPDFRAAKLLFKLATKGDDVLLRAITDEFESEGFQVVGPHVYAPQLLTPAGLLTKRKPSDMEKKDLVVGWKIARELGRMDIGQCVVVREGVITAVEAIEGTDAAVKRGCSLGGKGCSIVKVFKPGQEDRVDMPSIGFKTVQGMKELGATCLGVEAGKSLFFDLDKSIEFADNNGICIVGLTSDWVDN